MFKFLNKKSKPSHNKFASPESNVGIRVGAYSEILGDGNSSPRDPLTIEITAPRNRGSCALAHALGILREDRAEIDWVEARYSHQTDKDIDRSALVANKSAFDHPDLIGHIASELARDEEFGWHVTVDVTEEQQSTDIKLAS